MRGVIKVQARRPLGLESDANVKETRRVMYIPTLRRELYFHAAVSPSDVSKRCHTLRRNLSLLRLVNLVLH
jgi:hypothetical protein